MSARDARAVISHRVCEGLLVDNHIGASVVVSASVYLDFDEEISIKRIPDLESGDSIGVHHCAMGGLNLQCL